MTEPTYRIRVLFDALQWAYYHRCKALEKYAPDDFEVTSGPDYGLVFRKQRYDLALQLVYPATAQIRKHIRNGHYKMVLVAGMNVGWKEGAPWFPKVYPHADWVLFNNEMIWKAAGEKEHTSWISNGVDRDVFRCRVPFEQRKPKCLWLGSKFHRKQKGFDDILVPVTAALKEHGIETAFHCVDSHAGRRLKTHAQLAEWYNTGTIYIVASKTEGTPNPALEAASCGCVVVATRVGNMPELIRHGVNGELVNRDAAAIRDAVLRCQARYPEMAVAMQAEIAKWHWRDRAPQYFDLFRRLIDAQRAGVTAPAASAVA